MATIKKDITLLTDEEVKTIIEGIGKTFGEVGEMVSKQKFLEKRMKKAIDNINNMLQSKNIDLDKELTITLRAYLVYVRMILVELSGY